ncbi:hypothetical protein DKX38_008256 [Salix brachista]|uniref:Uncharacterized protein n=1 Tax=Salix brachista TaxID=2182728 RepID=A0A5N5MQP6_9ROSI|nr:hypothetical protein DKX38_008256 [Salix brachista]
MEVLKVTTVEEVVSILLPQTPEKARELVRWSFYKRPPRMPSWFLWDFIEFNLIIAFLNLGSQALLDADYLKTGKGGTISHNHALPLHYRLLSVGFALLLPVFGWVLGAPAAAFKPGWHLEIAVLVGFCGNVFPDFFAAFLTYLINTFSTINRNLNFIEHTSHWAEKRKHSLSLNLNLFPVSDLISNAVYREKRGMPLIVDPGLYSTTKANIYGATPLRSLPTAFKLFTASAWMVLTPSFVECLIWGWDNLPRTLLIYYTNFISSPEGYFHTVICNVPEFAQTAVSHDLHYIAWDNPPKQHPHILTINDTNEMIASGAAFARKFKHDDPVLDKIDKDLLCRKNGSFTPG